MIPTPGMLSGNVYPEKGYESRLIIRNGIGLPKAFPERGRTPDSFSGLGLRKLFSERFFRTFFREGGFAQAAQILSL